MGAMLDIYVCCNQVATPFHCHYALVMGLQGGHGMIYDTEKAALRIRFDALKAQITTPSPPQGRGGLDKIGVGTRRTKQF